MNDKELHILIIEDNPGDTRLIREMLREAEDFQFSLEHAVTLSEGCKKLRNHGFDLIMLDLNLPDSDGIDAISDISKLAPDKTIVILTSLDDEETAISALQNGAQDYLVKGMMDSKLLVRSLRYAIERKQAQIMLTKAKEELEVRVRERTADLLIANDEISASNALLKLFSQTFSRKEYLDSVLELVGKWSTCRYFSIKVPDDKGGVSCSAYRGLGSEFCMQEAAMSFDGNTCICARVIKEKPEQQELPFMSRGGSFFCNNFIEFVNSLKEEEKAGYLRGCIQSGFKSIAAIPIRYQNRVIGVFHLADKNDGKVSLNRIEFLESMMLIVGEAVHRFSVEEDRAMLMAAAESAPDVIVITDAKGIIQYVNPAFTKVTGYSREEALKANLHILNSGKQDESFFRTIRNVVGKGRVWEGNLINKKKDGTLYHENCTIIPVKDYTGKVYSYISVMRDITDKLRMESIAEAVDAMNNLGYVFSGIRHEIGNPVNSIKMALNLLKIKVGDCSQETILEYINRVLEEVLRIEYLLKSLKTFNMYETPEIKNIRVPDFLEKFLALGKNNCETNGVAITSSIEPDAEFCLADPRVLQQVLLNLLTNAIDACTARQGPRISIIVSKSSGMILMRISDNGCGMTEEQQRNIFRPFYTTKPDGTGLGLVIVKKLLVRMGSSIEIRSRINEGTEVDIFMTEGKGETGQG